MRQNCHVLDLILPARIPQNLKKSKESTTIERSTVSRKESLHHDPRHSLATKSRMQTSPQQFHATESFTRARQNTASANPDEYHLLHDRWMAFVEGGMDGTHSVLSMSATLIMKFSVITLIDLKLIWKCYKFLLLMNIITKSIDINTYYSKRGSLCK